MARPWPRTWWPADVYNQHVGRNRMTCRGLGLVLLLSLVSAAPTTAPSSLEVRANTAFSNGQYALALPLLQKVADQYRSEPDKLGPVQEQIKVCKTQIA